jgi:uncharacterized membrane protein YoaK (UPF0700 family)
MEKDSKQLTGRTFDGFQLKLFAIFTMLIDHIAAIVLVSYLDVAQVKMVYWVMRGIGRLAFPIFCFFIVEGFFHTSSRSRYALRLFVFALISEIPFDLAFHNHWYYADYQNVYFTLLLGLLTIWGMDAGNHYLSERMEGKKRFWLSCLLVAGCTVVGALLAELLHTDYGAIGVCVIVILYRWYFSSRAKGMALGSVVLLFSSYLEIISLVDVWLISRYNGERGRRMKYFFYVFYPLHILLLYLLRVWMGI